MFINLLSYFFDKIDKFIHDMIVINMFTFCKERRQCFWRKHDLFWFILIQPVHWCTQCDHSNNLSAVQFSNESTQSCLCLMSGNTNMVGAINPWKLVAFIQWHKLDGAQINFLWNCCAISYSENHVSCHCYLNQL